MVFMVVLRINTCYSSILLMFTRQKWYSWAESFFHYTIHTFISSTVSCWFVVLFLVCFGVFFLLFVFFMRGVSNPWTRMQHIKLNYWAGLVMYGFPGCANDKQVIMIELISTCIALCILEAPYKRWLINSHNTSVRKGSNYPEPHLTHRERLKCYSG